MSAVATIEDDRNLSPVQTFRRDLSLMSEQFAAALPSHIKPEKFQRVVMTAVLSDPSILNADRKSLMESAIRAAQDGLLPDKREGAFVVFNTKVGNQWVKAVQWMPMIGGVIKRIHQSGEVSTITAKVVFGGDTFRSWIDDQGEHVSYEQAELPDYDTIRQVFAMAKMKDGSIYVETLTPRDIEKIRSVSRSKDSGPWATWWEEMAKKSAIRRLSKRLPLSTEIHDLIARDDAMYDLSRAPEQRPSLSARLAAGASAPALTDAREGFTHSMDAVSREASAEATLPASAHIEADGIVPTGPEAREDEFPASEASEDSVGDTDVVDAPPSPFLIDYARTVLTAAGTAGTNEERVENVEAKHAELKPKLAKGDIERAKSILRSAQAVACDKADLDAALSHFAGLLGVHEDALWEAA